MIRRTLPPLRRMTRQAHTRAHSAQRDPEPVASVLGWLITRPAVDLALSMVVRSPRVLMGLTALVGLLLTALAIHPLVRMSSDHAGVQYPAPISQVVTPTSTTIAPEHQAILSVIAHYNQASIAAGLLGKADLLAPYLAPEGAAWKAVQAEYARRQARGETSDAALVRWGVLQIQVADDVAWITTQEQWDVVTSVGGAVIASRRGVLVRNTYELRRSPQAGWLIVTVQTTTLVA